MSTTSADSFCSIDIGFAFFDNTKGDGHLHFIGSDPRQSLLVTFNMTTIRFGSDTSCTFQAGEHPWVKWPTCIAWPLAELTTAETIETGLASGDYTAHKSPLKPELIQRVWDGAEITKNLKPRAKAILQQQGLIRPDVLPSMPR